MIVIPMIGRSRRFFDAGYSLPKFQLPLRGETVFSQVLRSFEAQFKSIPFLFLVRDDYNSATFVENEVFNLGIQDYRIVEFKNDTRGQAESVMIGIRDYDGRLPMVVFNIDTIRHNFIWPSRSEFGDGFLEVFHADGDGWSFVEPLDEKRVLRTAEKIRISNLCSNGMYGFSKIDSFRAAFTSYESNNIKSDGEFYIAPLYNLMIKEGLDIRYKTLPSSVIEHCGVPEDYVSLNTASNLR